MLTLFCSLSQHSDKKGRGRGNKNQQYNDAQAPIPGFLHNSPRQERRGRGNKPYREEPDAYYANTRSNRGRGVNRYSLGNYTVGNVHYYHVWLDIMIVIKMKMLGCIFQNQSCLYLRIKRTNLHMIDRSPQKMQGD